MSETLDKIEKTDAEWRAQLSDLAYEVTRRKGTERPGSNEDFPPGPGIFACVCCGAALFDAADRYESGSGWPSFRRAISEGAVAEREDDTLFVRRIEALCARCDAHLGHVFTDGPPPSGLRFCMNGAALTFEGRERG